MHNLDFHLQRGSRSHVNMPIESQYVISCVGNVNLYPICHHYGDVHVLTFELVSIRIIDLEKNRSR